MLVLGFSAVPSVFIGDLISVDIYTFLVPGKSILSKEIVFRCASCED